ncbi:Calpain-like protease palB/cpr-8 [Pleurostoma richardsiae]|uniref:Calpain-like protease palB/cpr-8 n=1 Tax=Pleurostoma richardsiae TaxID=41990 RepID=A0AA38VVG5_9PEZI|nr:Calpain-like protease palB/cpr-8 [Pleurostoma richardsiae]
MEAKAREHESQISRSAGKEALDHAIAAAELYMKAVRDARTPADKSRLKRKCEELIATAERLKNPSTAPAPAQPRGPRNSRELPTAEKNILLRSSRLHGSIFPPWESDPSPSSFKKNTPRETPFTDTSEFSFSDRQKDILAGWKRPAELLTPGASSNTGQVPGAIVAAQAECDLVQDVTTDCSVVASLCAAMKHLQPGKDSILAALMYPFDPSASRPAVSENGKYVFRLNFNGCFRQVVVDDRLPYSKTSRTLFVVDRHNPELLWPALMEKAYLKIRGGYDFPGSNSGTDLWVLTGWIPEQIFLQSDDIELDQTWKRIKNAYDYGDVVVTLGTGRMSSQEEEVLGLAGEHDYAVMDMRVESGARRMLLKNPWVDGLVWKGIGSSAIAGSDPSSDSESTRSSNMTGTFWIAFEDVVQNFESLYLNWNPSLFTDRQDHHFTWTIPSGPEAQSLAPNPQYAFSSPFSGAVWVLLSRHFQDDELAIARRSSRSSSPSSSSMAAVSGSLGFTSLYLFSADGHRVDLPDRALHRGPYVDSPQTLLRVDARAGTTYTLVVAQQDLPLPKYSFTLSFFSRHPLTVSPAAPRFPHRAEAAGSWTRRTAGGNPSCATFLHNPQFAVTLARPARVSLLLTASAPDLPVRVDLAWARGARVTALAGARDIAASSGEYRRGRALAEAAGPPLAAGTYTAVVSTFEPGQLASFALRVGADAPVAVAPVLADGAGQLCLQLPPVPLSGGGGGGAGRQAAAVRVGRLTRLSVVVRSGSLDGAGPGPAAGVMVRTSLEAGRGPHRRTLAVTGDGEFADGGLGLRAGEVDLDPEEVRRAGGLWMVVEQMGGGIGGGSGLGIQVDVLSDCPLDVGPWQNVDD